MIPVRCTIYRKLVIICTTSVLYLCSFLAAAFGCPYSIRDAGFIVREPRPYRLTVLVNDHTPLKDQLAQWLTEAATKHLSDSNVVVEVVNVDQQPHPKLTTDFASLVPDRLPAAILISPRNKAISLPGLGPEELTGEAVEEVVRRVVVSPKRAEMTAHIITDWCVVVVVKGADAAENQRIAEAVAAARKALVGTTTEMEQNSAKGPYVITLSPDDAAEKVFMWSIGLDPDDKTQARVAVLFGMGRRIGPVLQAEEVSESMLTNAFLLLGRSCSCTSDPRWLLGPVVPLVWGEDLQRQVGVELGFDPNSPAVAATLGGVWRALDTLEGQDGEGSVEDDDVEYSFVPPSSSGYVEFSVGPDVGEAQEAIDTDSATATIEHRSLRIVIGLTVVLVLIALVGGAVFWLHQRKAG